jgi:hypothetical protein
VRTPASFPVITFERGSNVGEFLIELGIVGSREINSQAEEFELARGVEGEL